MFRLRLSKHRCAYHLVSKELILYLGDVHLRRGEVGLALGELLFLFKFRHPVGLWRGNVGLLCELWDSRR